jgi:beta-1,4-mannosyl-glycoprotein beta-1,4-N-acetylglucosaminyltransferase
MKIFDCFPFFNEISLLDMRLNYLQKIVDKFVIVEGTHSHQRKIKKLYYDENKSLFKKYENKIIHIVQDSYPSHLGDTHSNFIFDYHTRNGISKGLRKCFDNDIILISDVDEFPDINKFSLFNGNLTIFKQLMFYFKFNLRVKNFNHDNGDGLWPGTRMLSFKLFKRMLNVQKIRNIRAKEYAWWRFDKPKLNIIRYGGWHFRFIGTANELKNELENRAIGRGENILSSYNEIDINNIIENQLPFTTKEERFEVYPISKMPSFIKLNQNKYKDFLIV